MASPDVVAKCIKAMRAVVDKPVTVKTRIGIDECDDYAFLRAFIEQTAAAGCNTFIVHARKAILSGLSPKENRSIPPLIYERVYRVKEENPELTIILNGGVTTIEECRQHLKHVDGIMIGRQAYHRPWFLTELETAYGGGPVPVRRSDIVEAMIPYIRRELASGTLLKHITRHMLGLFAGEPGARQWRRFLSENAHRPGAGIDVVLQALEKLSGVAAASPSGDYLAVSP